MYKLSHFRSQLKLSIINLLKKKVMQLKTLNQFPYLVHKLYLFQTAIIHLTGGQLTFLSYF